MAEKGSAQSVKSVREVIITIDTQWATINELFSEIEAKTNFRFFLENKHIDNAVQIKFKKKKIAVDEILMEISKQTDLKFKQVNNTINVTKKSDGTLVNEPDVTIVLQEQLVSGRVISSDGEALPGVNIVIKGSTVGTITDAGGNYSLNVPSESAVLVFSYIGYTREEITVGSQSVINLTMMPDITALQEIIVVGYGEQRKETLTGSVSNIKGEEITKSPSANVSANLAGRLPGLIVNQRSGEPGRDDPNIIIRGLGTYRDNAPLVVVDGVPRALMSRLNPEDIESISVLKDASAAIYGARAANGVILITTKRGKQGKPVFDFSYNHAF